MGHVREDFLLNSSFPNFQAVSLQKILKNHITLQQIVGNGLRDFLENDRYITYYGLLSQAKNTNAK